MIQHGAAALTALINSDLKTVALSGHAGNGVKTEI
jgi:hypothetical protein